MQQTAEKASAGSPSSGSPRSVIPHEGSASPPSALVQAALAWLEDRVEAAELALAAASHTPGGLTTAEIFASATVPEITPADYLTRLLAYGLQKKSSDVIEVILLHALVLLERLEERTGLLVHLANVHRLMLVCLLLSSKCLDDETYSNRRWALAGGVTNEHLNTLELEAACMLTFDLNPSADEADAMHETLLPPLPPESRPVRIPF